MIISNKQLCAGSIFSVCMILIFANRWAWAVDYPPVFKSMVDRGIKVEKSFPAKSGLTGWVVSRNGQYNIFYTTKDQKTIIAGNLVDGAGKDLSEEHRSQYIPQPNINTAFDKLEKSAYVIEGDKNPESTLYAFFDPNCPFCHKAWLSLQDYEKAGLQVRWIPVAYLSQSSVSKAVEILGAKDRTSVFRSGMQSFAKNHSAPADSSAMRKPKLLAILEENSVLMHEFGINATPAFVWKQKNGVVKKLVGLPKLSDFQIITGIDLKK